MKTAPSSVGVSSRYPLTETIRSLGLTLCDTATVRAYQKKFHPEQGFFRFKKELTNTQGIFLIFLGLGLHMAVLASVGRALWGESGLLLGMFPVVFPFFAICIYVSDVMLGEDTEGVTYKGWRVREVAFVLALIVAGLWLVYLIGHYCRPQTKNLISLYSPVKDKSCASLDELGLLIQEKCPGTEFYIDQLIDDGIVVDYFLVLYLRSEKCYLHPNPERFQ